ncbi:MAG: YitT family protein [Bacillota bacterium]|nr:YitT family protein [Bacillota bacterium]
MLRKYIWDLIGIIIGTAVMAVSFNMFLIPNKIAAGGISGLGVILFHLFQVPVGLTVLLANVPLFILAWSVLGWRIVAHSLAGTILLPFMLELTAFLPLVTKDLLLASVFGGIGAGLGIGLVFRSQGTTGGTALVAQLFNRFWGFSSGQSLIGADLVIIVAAGFFFDAEVALFALLSLFVSGKVIDIVQEGFSFSKAALIISEKKQDAITEKIFEELGRGATFLDGRGAYSGDQKGIILCIVSQSQVTRLKNIVREIDPLAFVIVSNVGEVLGEGFGPI